MSTLRVSSINNAAASAGGITIDSSGGVSGALPAPNRNLLYNGAMQVSQRGTSTTSITTGGYYTADRWLFAPTAMGTWTQTSENDAPTGSGFRKSTKVLCTTADSTPAASDILAFDQRIEGQDLQRIKKGTSSAEQLTLSFWVKSNVTGTYVATLQDIDNTRQVGAQYTISASGIWEKKTITFPADTTGAFDNDNGESLRLRFWLGSGSDRTSGTLRTAWTSQVAADLAVGQTNLAAATNNYWQVTGVQLEVGDVATDFEFKSFGQELRECQRYYEQSYDYGTVPGTATATGAETSFPGAFAVWFPVTFKVTKRVTPTTFTTYSPFNGATGNISINLTSNVAVTGVISLGQRGCNIYNGSTNTNVSAYVHWIASAEL